MGEAEIILKQDAKPIKQRMFQIQGERREAWLELADKYIAQGKWEDGVSPWSSPSFPVAKKEAGNYRLVVDFRAVNEATITDGHPLPLIGDILQKQGNFKMWSVLDMKDGFHQVPLKKEHRHITCMSTPRGTKQWTVLVMGLKNAGAIFQRVMEKILEGLDFAVAYIDDVIIGSTGDTEEELVANHEKNVRAVLDRLEKHRMYASPKKAHLFVREVEFCGHVLREGRRSPAPGKLLSLHKWEAPRIITQLRGFLGLTNYYSGYVKNYAEIASPLMDMLQVGKHDGKKGSTLPLKWNSTTRAAFEELKRVLTTELELYTIDPDKPFVLRADASDKAVGAVLEQQTGDKWNPVGFFSRKLGKSQLNWTPREKETYAVVSALTKWAGWIGLQPILITTDHKSLEDWVKEKIDTPSGPAGRRARWHETLSKFDLTVVYVPGKDNVVADALSRYAYPACSAFQDTSFHGSSQAQEEMDEIIRQELAEGKCVGLISKEGQEKFWGAKRVMWVAGTISRPDQLDPRQVFPVTTRSGRVTDPVSEPSVTESVEQEPAEPTPKPRYNLRSKGPAVNVTPPARPEPPAKPAPPPVRPPRPIPPVKPLPPRAAEPEL